MNATSGRKYDPGTVRDFEEIAPGTFHVHSYRENKWYRVDTAAGTCGCPAFERHGRCKHVSDFTVIAKAARKSLRYLDGKIAEFTASGDEKNRARAEAAKGLVQARQRRAVEAAMAAVRSREYLPL